MVVQAGKPIPRQAETEDQEFMVSLKASLGYMKLYQNIKEAGKMIQQVKEHATNPNNPSFIESRIHTVGENQFLQVTL